MVGRRHYEVAKLLKDIPKGSVFTLRLIEPQKAGFCKLQTTKKKKYRLRITLKCHLFCF